jgi:hypothetical protein
MFGILIFLILVFLFHMALLPAALVAILFALLVPYPFQYR